MLHYIYETPETSRKAKLNVSYSLLRKPIQESLYVLEAVSVDRGEFSRKLSEDPLKLYSQGAGGRAVRALLINTALEYRLAAPLQFNFLTARAELLFDSNFSYVPRGQTYVCDDQAYCEELFEISTGRFLHVIISADGFSGYCQCTPTHGATGPRIRPGFSYRDAG